MSGGNCKWADTSFKYDIKATPTPRATVCASSLIGVERSQQQSRVKVYCVCVAVICRHSQCVDSGSCTADGVGGWRIRQIGGPFIVCRDGVSLASATVLGLWGPGNGRSGFYVFERAPDLDKIRTMRPEE